MIKQISKLPLGLLDAFGVKSMGSYPRDVANEIVSTFDISDLQFAQQEIAYQLFTTFNAGSQVNGYTGLQDLLAAGNPLFVVPAGNVFMIRSFQSYYLINTAGVAYTLPTPLVTVANSAGSYQRALPQYQTFAAILSPAVGGLLRIGVGTWQGNIIMPPGSLIGAEFGVPSAVIPVGDSVTFVVAMTGLFLQA